MQIDLNLYGMGLLRLGKALFRHPVPEAQHSRQGWACYGTGPRLVLLYPRKHTSPCVVAAYMLPTYFQHAAHTLYAEWLPTSNQSCEAERVELHFQVRRMLGDHTPQPVGCTLLLLS